MKVLIITYYWPPAGGSGVQRWLKFVKYLPEFGIKPVVFCPHNSNYPKVDESLQKEVSTDLEVIQHPYKDVFAPFQTSKKTQKGVATLTNNKFLNFVRGNFFIPDPKVFWVKSVTTYLSNYLKNNQIDAIITTGPPHSMHLIGKKLAEKHQLKWVTDFRDPWSEIYYNQEFYQLPLAKWWNQKLEKSVLQKADLVLTVSEHLQKYLLKIAPKVEVITNGFDDENLTRTTPKLDEKFTISYIGLMPKSSIPHTFFEVLKEICTTNLSFKNDLQLHFIGDISIDLQAVLQNNKLEENAIITGYIPHQQAIAIQQTSQVLLLTIPNVAKNECIVTGKFFEYLASNRPIFAIGPTQGDLSQLINYTKSGVITNHYDKEQIKEYILGFYHQYKEQKLAVNSVHLADFHRKELTKKLASILKNI